MKSIYLILVLLILFNIKNYSTTYYNKSTGIGALQTLSNWGTATNGTGTAPSNFTTSGDIFNLYNGTTGTISAAWVITGVTLNVGDGTNAMNLTVPSGFTLTGTGTVAVSASGTLTIQNTTNPTLGTLNAAGTVNYNGTGAQTVAAATYGNLTISGTRAGTPAITLSGSITVKGTFAITESGAVTYTTTGNTFIYGATTGGQTVKSVIPYAALTMSNTSGTQTADGNMTVSGVLTTTAGGTLNMSTFTLSETGAPVNNGTIQTQNTSATPLSTGKTWAGTINYNAATGGQTVVSATSYATLTLGNTSGTQTAAAATVVNTALNTTAGGIFDMSTFALSGTLTTITNNGTIQTENTSVTPLTSGKTWGGTGIVKYNVTTGGQTVMLGTYNCGLTLSNTSGTQTASGVLTVNGTLTTSAGGTLNMVTFAIAGAPSSVTNAGTINTQSVTNAALPTGQNWSGTINYNKLTGAQFIPAGTYNNLTLSNTSGTQTANGVLTINGALITTSGGTLAMGTNQMSGTPTSITNNGTITTSSTANPAIPTGQNWTGTTGKVAFGLTTGGQFVPAGTYKTLTFANTSGTNTALGDIAVTTALTTSAAGGTLDMGTNALTGAFTPTNTGILLTQNTSSTPIPSGKTWAGIVNYNAATGGQTVVSETSYATLTLGNTSGTQTAAAALVVNTALNTTVSGIFDMSTFALSGTLTTITNNGTIQTENTSATPFTTGKTWGGSGIVNYNATTGGQTVMLGTYTCGLTLSNTSGTQTASGAITVNGVLNTTSGGTLAMGTNQLLGSPTSVNNDGSITTSCTVNPAIPAGQDWTGITGFVTFSTLTGGQSVPSGTYQTLIFSNTSGTNTATGTLTINGALTTTSGGTLNMSTNQMTGTPTSVTNNGAIVTSSTANPALPAGQAWSGTTGTVTFTLTTGGQFVPAGTFKTLVFSNTSGTNTAVGALAVTTALTTSAAGGTLDMGTNTLSGAFTPTNTGTLLTQNTSSTPIPSGKTWAGTVNYNAATGGQTVVSETSYATLTMGNTSGTQTAAAALTVNTALNTTASGIFDMSTFALSGTLSTITLNGDLETENISTTPFPSGKTWGGAGDVVYNAATGGQTIVSGTYNGLTNSNTSGTNTIVSAGTVSVGDLTLSASSTLNDNGVTITVTGNIVGTGTHTGTGKISMTSSGASISGATLNNLTLNNTGGFSLSGSPTINGILTCTAGKITIGTNTLTLAGTVTGMSSTNSFTGSASSNLTITGTGALGTLFFDQTTPGTTNNISTFTLNRTSSGAATLGNALSISTGLTLTAGTLTDGGNGISIQGDWTNNLSTAAFTSTGTVTFNNSGSQSITGSSGTAFNNVTIASGSTTTISTAGQTIAATLLSDGTLNANGNVTLLSNATQTALIDGSGSGSVSGNVIIQRYLDTGLGYRYVSSPFTLLAVSGFSGSVNFNDTFPQFYSYNENATTSGWVIDTVPSSTLTAMHGYAANFGLLYTPKTISITGAVNNGTISYSLFNHNQTYTLGFNLVGNPYPSPIDWNASSGWTKTNIDNALYYFDASDTNRYTGTYSSYVAGVSSDGVANNIIPAMQGFFVHVSNGTYPVTGSLGVTNSVRINNLTPVYHKSSASQNIPLIRLDARFSNADAHPDPAVVYFNDAAISGFDKNLDALKILNTDIRVPSLYTISADTTHLSIKAITIPSDSSRFIPLGLITENDGWIIFNARDIENIPGNMHVSLFDAVNEITQNIQSNPEYKVYLTSGKYENRFFLIFTTNDKVNIPGLINELNAYTNGKKLFVYVTNNKANLAITNMLGQVIDRENLNGTGYHEIDLNVTPGIYVATLFSNMGKQSKKIIIDNQ